MTLDPADRASAWERLRELESKTPTAGKLRMTEVAANHLLSVAEAASYTGEPWREERIDDLLSAVLEVDE